MGRLNGKTCLVTAAGQGIGRASALAMAREGARVVATDVNVDALSGLSAEGLETRLLDVLNPTAITDAAEEVGAPDVLFNCAGAVEHGTILDCDEDKWAFALELNVTAAYRMMRAFLPAMIANGGGSIINMSSVLSHVIGAPSRFSYTATKAAVVGMTKAVAADHIGDDIRCNAICPGTVESPSWSERVKALGEELGSYEAAHQAFVSRQPLGRVATADEIAWLVVYLASDESAYTTGIAHVIDGGWSNT